MASVVKTSAFWQTTQQMKIRPFLRQLKRRLVTQPRARLGFYLLRLFSGGQRRASLFYAFFSSAFRREHQSVLKGRLAYEQSLRQADVDSSPLMRRNIHRLEKGLIMRPMRDVFALDYLQETITEFLRVSAAENYDQSEYCWARDVLRRYFNEVQHNERITTQYERIKHLLNGEQGTSHPYQRATVKPVNITPQQFEQLCLQRRSVRWFENREVPQDELNQALRAATMAPSACNRQPYEFYVNRGAKAVEVASLAMGTKGFAENIPCLLAVVGDLSAYPFERDRHVIYIDASLASMNLMLSLETQGLASCPINWPDIEERERKMAAALQLKPHQRVIMLIAVGYPLGEGQIPFSQKKSPQQLLKNQ